MPIEYDNASPLPPLKTEKPPVLTPEALAAIGQVTLAAGDVPPRILREFYQQVLGVSFRSADVDTLVFEYHRRVIVLQRQAQPGQAVFLVKDFSDLRLRLRDRAIPHEVIHGDAGLARSAYLRDPAGNIIQLVETRAL